MNQGSQCHNVSEKGANHHLELVFLRHSIDNIDEAILSILMHRAQLINHIIQYKKTNNIPLVRSELREKNIDDLMRFSSTLTLRVGFIRKIIDCLFERSDAFYKNNVQKEINEFFSFNEGMIGHFNLSLQHMDIAFFSVLSERMHLVKSVGEYKKRHNIPPLAEERWKRVLNNKMKMAESLNINAKAIQKLYALIHEEALAIEGAVKNSD